MDREIKTHKAGVQNGFNEGIIIKAIGVAGPDGANSAYAVGTEVDGYCTLYSPGHFGYAVTGNIFTTEVYLAIAHDRLRGMMEMSGCDEGVKQAFEHVSEALTCLHWGARGKAIRKDTDNVG